MTDITARPDLGEELREIEAAIRRLEETEARVKREMERLRLEATRPDDLAGKLAEALGELLAETELTYGTQIMDRQDAARAALAEWEAGRGE